MFSIDKKIGFKKFEMTGQFTVVALIMVFIMLLMFVKFYPTMKDFIDELIPQVDELTGILISLIPFFIAAAIIMSITWYIIPKKS